MVKEWWCDQVIACGSDSLTKLRYLRHTMQTTITNYFVWARGLLQVHLLELHQLGYRMSQTKLFQYINFLAGWCMIPFNNIFTTSHINIIAQVCMKIYILWFVSNNSSNSWSIVKLISICRHIITFNRKSFFKTWSVRTLLGYCAEGKSAVKGNEIYTT